MAATGTVQRRSVRAPQATTTSAMGRRNQSGNGRANWLRGEPGPCGGIAEAEGDGRGHQEVDVTVVQLEGNRGEREHGEDRADRAAAQKGAKTTAITGE